VAIPLHPEYGTTPNVFYVPPMSPQAFDEEGELTDEMRIPDSVLESYFGKAVHKSLAILIAAREKKKQGKKSRLMDLLISRKWQDRFAEFTKHPV